MKDNQPSVPMDLRQATARLRDLARHARLAELLDPQEFAEYAAEVLPNCRERGYAVRTVLAPSDINLLTDDASPSDTRLAVGELEDGLPFVVISLEFEARRFRWVVPLWQPGAQEWLADSIRQKRALLAVEATDMSVAVALYVGGVFEDTRLLARAKRVNAAVADTKDVGSLLAAGHVGAFALLRPPHETAGPCGDVRVMVAARGKVAHEVMSAWTALALSIDDRVPPHELLLH